MNHPDEQDVDPEDIFEEIEPNEPEPLDAKIRGGEAVDPEELTYEDDTNTDADEAWEAQENYLEHLDDVFHREEAAPLGVPAEAAKSAPSQLRLATPEERQAAIARRLAAGQDPGHQIIRLSKEPRASELLGHLLRRFGQGQPEPAAFAPEPKSKALWQCVLMFENQPIEVIAMSYRTYLIVPTELAARLAAEGFVGLLRQPQG